MRRGARRAALLILCAVLLCGCTATPPDTLMRSDPADSALISADTRALTPDAWEATLYFRYKDTAYLVPEKATLSVQRNESAEKALVQALLDGPGATASALAPLFPPGTEVLAVSRQGDTLFVTFNEALLGRYGDEPGDAAAGKWKTEGPLRRKLCLDALTATLTEAGLCAQVQVLVYRGGGQATSMRLHAGFFTRGADETLLPPLTRDEESLWTPHNAASALLNAWMTQNWAALYDFTLREGAAARPGEQTAAEAFAGARVLTGFAVSAGNVSLDGQTAVLTADLTLRGEGGDVTRGGYPLRLRREAGIWKIDYAALTAMMNQ